ncbi:MAG: hypothetical protein COU63_00145 [Candidatus Pacebacteria bacterium CG10_big_fil_rev_8_21_14_0_10_36_11]|nr:hypothetical protein [Candidatus Pacearchaeota archaeon]OIP74169.1 MAG: hypothetical protein AUK08_02895 [Candidatus Pacebacteria bacterium CG2_30_36_39]PIR65072.1 MAG: hypothetical protein COU63_00145 [Candidatus Pacebacteria bacterium CG10_big_fil_rev_8_21_14_0_10_36_11]PJC43226.1 MAG: hypothetical protein CO040_00210 [Candidatus Pacebacteria bacterium CG_4_9_14_0_2_um_filter_36_8]
MKKKKDSRFETIERDLLDKETWSQIQNNLDLVLAMPRGALYDLPDSLDSLYFLINNIWAKMNKNGSMALLQIPFFLKKEFLAWYKIVRSKNVSITYSIENTEDTDKDTYIAVCLVKKEDDPDNLPILD